ncbi:MAG TPA: FadR/GntR family transcriptional regulator [Planctomycetota bacterium]|nr:FadR/GntR family transcriptional regulator [Planctomycetota bacterium]
MVFQPIGRGVSLVDSVVNQVQHLIADGHLESGDRLPKEDELVEQMGVSRTVLREALSRLEATGLVTIQRGRGMFVAEASGVSSCARLIRNAMTLSGKDLAQFMEFRRIIECQAARRAAELATPEDLAELETLCLEMNREGLDFLESVRLDFQFHLKIVKISGNELMQGALAVIQEYIMATMVKTTPNPRDYDWSREVHMRLVEAIRTGAPEIAEKAARDHMDGSENSLMEREGKRQGRVEPNP